MEKVLLIIPTLVGHGAERMAVLASTILQNKYEVILVVFTMENQQYIPSCKIVNLNIPAQSGVVNKVVNLIKRSFALWKLRKEIKPKAVISFGPSSNYVNVFSKSIGKTIISFRGFASVKNSLALSISCFLADNIFCISKDLKLMLDNECGFAALKSSVIYNGADLKNIDKLKTENIEKHLSKPTFVCVARLEAVKGHKHLIKAFRTVVDKFHNANLVLVGDGSLKQELSDLVHKLMLDENVIFVGAQKNPFKYIYNSDICVQSSITEGFLNVLVEALACGKPCISTNCRSGPSEILGNSVYKDCNDILYEDYGILVPGFKDNESTEPEKEFLMAQAMIELVNNEGLYQKYASVAYGRAQNFSEEEYYKCLCHIIGEKNERNS